MIEDSGSSRASEGFSCLGFSFSFSASVPDLQAT
jgi:hypothetical protein